MRIFRVLLVDDEPYVREGLREFIPWADYGFSVCGEAENGAEALRLIDALHPDLLFVDIRMPVMDGLELLKTVDALPEPPKAVILSGYEDFSYYQEAIRYGVIGYLNKPLYPQEAGKLLAKAYKELAHEEEKRLRLKQGYEDIFKDDYNAVIHLDTPDEWIQRRFCSALSIEPTEALVPVLLEKRAPETESWTNAERQMVFETVARIWGVCSVRAFSVLDRRRMLVLCPFRLIREGDTRAAANQTEAALLKQNFPAFTLYIGKLCSVSDGLSQNVRALCLLAASANDEQASRVKMLRDENVGTTHSMPLDEMLAVIRAVENTSQAQLRNALAALRGFIARQKAPLRDVVSCVGVTKREIVRSLRACGMEPPPDYHGPDGTQGELWHSFETWCGDCVTTLCGGELTDGERIVANIRRDLNGNPSAQTSLADMAERYHINAVYLGKLFKKLTGHSFSDYLCVCRIERAKRLLLETERPVALIAEDAGFHDASYFSKRFREEVGMLPTEYREKSR